MSPPPNPPTNLHPDPPPQPEWHNWKHSKTLTTITTLDTLAHLLAPNDLIHIRIPGSAAKIPGEIRPRTKSLQQILRCVMFFEGSESGSARREIGARMER
ncbi:hypothetical protein IFR05_015211, partial [Cadophora sp. M221]